MRVRFFAFIRSYTGCAETDIPYEEISAGNSRTAGSDGSHQVTAGSLARSLCERYGEKLKEKIFPSGNTEEDKFGPEIIFLINGRHVNHLGGIDAPLKPDDKVDIFPVVAGG